MENDENYIIYDLTPEIEEMYAVQPMTQNKYKVYFDPETRNILSITNETHKTFTNYFEIDFSKVEKFLTGEQLYSKYKVILDKENNFEIVPIIINSNDFKFSEIVGIPITEADKFLTVKNYIADKKWIIEIDEDERNRLMGRLVNFRMPIFITSSKDRNFLYRVVVFDLTELVAKGQLTVDHISEIESVPSKISLSTIRFFESYGLRNFYEPKV